MPETIELVIPNMAEYFLRNPALNLTGPKREAVTLYGGLYETDTAVFWSASRRILLLPEGYNPAWFADVHQALGLEAPPVVSPRPRSGLIVRDLLDDGAAQAALRGALRGYRVVKMMYNGPTPDIYRLAAVLRGWGLTVEIDGVAEDDYWASVYLDSKISVLDLARELPEVHVANGLSVSSEQELRGAVRAMLTRYDRIIARSLYGVAGDGSAVTTAAPADLARFYETVENDSFFGAFPLVVQQHIRSAPGVGCPAADFLVGENGVEDIVLCSLTVADGYRFCSVNAGKGALPPVWAQRLTQVVHSLGEAARGLGFRGWMCADCVAGADETLYVTEINARRSGSQHCGSLLRLWHAEDSLTLSAHEIVPVPPGSRYEDVIRPVFEPLWAAGIRAYPTSTRGLAWSDPVISVTAAGETALEAERLVSQIAAAVGDRAAAIAA